MKTIRTYPNPVWLIINLFVLIFFGFLVLVPIEWIFEFIGFFKHSSENKIGMFFFLLFAAPIFLYFYYQISTQFVFAKLHDDGIKVFQLLRLKIINLSFDDIKGYSDSEVFYGEVSLNFVSKSIIIYSKNENPYEVIKLFNLNFKKFHDEIKKANIPNLGREEYQTGFYKRKYQFKK